jgi:hypothetical protein
LDIQCGSANDQALRLVTTSNVIAACHMELEEAILLLDNTLGEQETREEKHRLVQALEFMPLAITQATSYLVSSFGQCSVTEYLRMLESRSGLNVEFLKRCESDQRRDRERERTNSVLLTLQISFNHIQQKYPTAAKLLSLMSFFDRQAIPDLLLKDINIDGLSPYGADLVSDGASPGQHDRQVTTLKRRRDSSSTREKSVLKDDSLRHDIRTLISYSFVLPTITKHILKMHRLVQEGVQLWLSTREADFGYYQSQFLSRLDDAFPVDVRQDLALCGQIHPHAKVAMKLDPSDLKVVMKKTFLVFKCALYYTLGLDWSIYETYSASVTWMKLSQKYSPVDDVDSFQCLLQLATFWQARPTDLEKEQAYSWLRKRFNECLQENEISNDKLLLITRTLRVRSAFLRCNDVFGAHEKGNELEDLLASTAATWAGRQEGFWEMMCYSVATTLDLKLTDASHRIIARAADLP